MKRIIKLTIVLFGVIFFATNQINGQVKNNEIDTDVKVKNEALSSNKLNKRNWKLNKTLLKGGYMFLESDLYKAHLKRKLKRLKNKKKMLLSSSSASSKKTKSINNKISFTKKRIKSEEKRSQKTNSSRGESNGCGKNISEETCNKIKAIGSRIERVDEGLEDIRPCPDETHCFPVPFKRDIKYFLVPSKMKFKASIFSKDGKKIGKTGKPITIKGIKGYVAYPVYVNNFKGDMLIKVTRVGLDNMKVSYAEGIQAH